MKTTIAAAIAAFLLPLPAAAEGYFSQQADQGYRRFWQHQQQQQLQQQQQRTEWQQQQLRQCVTSSFYQCN